RETFLARIAPDAAVPAAAVAAADPILTLPARIGLARLACPTCDHPVPVPGAEMAHWQALADRYGAAAAFAQLSPLVVALEPRGRAPMDRLLRAAQRQHMDAVLIYAVERGRGHAALLDTRNGYPYLTAAAETARRGGKPAAARALAAQVDEATAQLLAAMAARR
ncbi:MAG: hypothetical protein AAGE76_17015, partial [Pseudomonadota bacterium]